MHRAMLPPRHTVRWSRSISLLTQYISEYNNSTQYSNTHNTASHLLLLIVFVVVFVFGIFLLANAGDNFVVGLVLHIIFRVLE